MLTRQLHCTHAPNCRLLQHRRPLTATQPTLTQQQQQAVTVTEIIVTVMLARHSTVTRLLSTALLVTVPV
jgi:hypothetical protein